VRGVMMRHDSGLCGVGGVGRCGAERLGAVRAAQGDAGWHIRFSTNPEAGRCGAKQDSEGRFGWRGAMQGGVGRRRARRGDAGQCGAMYCGVGRCRVVWGDAGWRGAMQGGEGRCSVVWGEAGRCGAM